MRGGRRVPGPGPVLAALEHLRQGRVADAALVDQLNDILARHRLGLGDGAVILELFERARSEMTPEEQQAFLADFADSVGRVLLQTNGALRQAFASNAQLRRPRKD
ncbi:MAG: hypothetical protein HY825_16120 [Acidobacteria bacterium]|nr:hypothetical protein [Acidobacteriota bacterium]